MTLLRSRFLTLIAILTMLLLAACGTIEVGVDEPATAIVSSPIETPTFTPPPVIVVEDATPATPLATLEASPETLPSDEPVPVPSSLWATYRDTEYGYGYAYPCFWLNYPSTLTSYDEAFAMANSIRGQWIDNQPPDGVVKVEVGVLDYAEYGLASGVPLGEAITIVAGDPYGTGEPPFESIEETTIGDRQAMVVRLGVQTDMWGVDLQREVFYFPTAEDRWFRFSVLPPGAINLPEVQAILDSVALSADEPINIPAFDPGAVVEGREFYFNQEAGYCLQYPAGFTVEEYNPGANTSIGQTASLKLERPLYTVGLTVQARPVPAQSTLDEQVTAFFQGFSEEVAAGIKRNPPELVAGVVYRLGGEPAEVLDGLPGAEKSLALFAIHDNRLFQLDFTPSLFDNPQASADVSLLYNVVYASFSFLGYNE